MDSWDRMFRLDEIIGINDIILSSRANHIINHEEDDIIIKVLKMRDKITRVFVGKIMKCIP